RDWSSDVCSSNLSLWLARCTGTHLHQNTRTVRSTGLNGKGVVDIMKQQLVTLGAQRRPACSFLRCCRVNWKNRTGFLLDEQTQGNPFGGIRQANCQALSLAVMQKRQRVVISKARGKVFATVVIVIHINHIRRDS